MDNRSLRVCYFGTYRANYSRNQILIEGLRRNGIEVVECHERLWQGIEDRVQAASGGWLRPRFIARALRSYWRLLRAYQEIDAYDIMVVGYPGQLDIYLARLLTWLRGKPLVLDVFMSIYLIASERGLVEKSPFTARAIYGLERLACTLPDRLILDTADYVDWFAKTYRIKESRFRLVPTGADNRTFRPLEGTTEAKEADTFDVLYYGTFIPNHGVNYIIEAARILREDPGIRLALVGEGPTKAQAVRLARRYELDNVVFEGWIQKEDIARRAADADVCLGAFGTTPQSLMTVQNKIYEGLAMGKAVITGDSLAIRRSLVHLEHVFVCERANPRSLADAIRTLQMDPEMRQRLAANGQRLFSEQLDLDHNGARFASHLRECLSNSGQTLSGVE